MAAGSALEAGDAFVMIALLAVGPIGGDRDVSVGDRENAGLKRNVGAALGVTTAVRAFVVGADPVCHLFKANSFGEHVSGINGVLAKLLELFNAEDPGFGHDPLRDPDLADVMDEGGPRYRIAAMATYIPGGLVSSGSP